MKQLSLLLSCIVAATTFAPTILAETTTTPTRRAETKQAIINLRLKSSKDASSRPKAPSSIYITCTYSSDGYLWFDNVQAAALNVTVTGLTSGFMADYITTPDQPIYIGTIAEDVEVTCHTSENQIFQGIITLSDL